MWADNTSVICRGGTVADTDTGFLRPRLVEDAPRPRRTSWARILAAFAMVVAVLAILPGRTAIPPLVESDYCYQLIAADRLFDGQGLTSPPPAAPFQSWEWTKDWGFLTNWPVGYSILVVALRKVLHLSTLDACRWISVAACATALVGWFAWTRRIVPCGLAGWLLSVVAAACAVSAASLINPSTDALLVAALPIVMLLAIVAVEMPDGSGDVRTRLLSRGLFVALGLLTGGLFWIRYASIFVPLAIGVFLALEWRLRRRLRVVQMVFYVLGALTPIVALLALHRAYGGSDSAHSQLNLGHGIGWGFTFSHILRTWWMFTDLGFYDHRHVGHWLYAMWPIGLTAIGLAMRPLHAAVRSFLGTQATILSLCVLFSGLGMLLCASTLFCGKFDYVGLDRYYVPLRPLYFVLFVAPVVLAGRRSLRLLACVALLIAASWTFQQEWSRTYRRWLASDRPVTAYGQWSRCFEPGAADLFGWLRAQQGPELVVVSNFHEYVTLETGIPALPIPPHREALAGWLGRVCEARGVNDLRVLFVLDPDNKWRGAWIPKPARVIEEFRLTRAADAPSYVYVYQFLETEDGNQLAEGQALTSSTVDIASATATFVAMPTAKPIAESTPTRVP